MDSPNDIASSSASRHPSQRPVLNKSSALSPAISSTDDDQTEPESDDDKTEPEILYSERVSPLSVSKGRSEINELLCEALRDLSEEHLPCSVYGVYDGLGCITGLHRALDIWRKALQEPSCAPPRIAYRLDRKDPKERKSLPYMLDELLAQKLDPKHDTVLRHLKIPATRLGFELYLANATLELVGSGNVYDPHSPLDDIEMLSWPKPKVTLTFSDWTKVGQGPIEAPPFEFDDDQWIPGPPPDDASLFNKEYDWASRPAPGELRELHAVTVIVIQSRQVGDDFCMSKISQAQASVALRESSTVAPTSEEEVLFRTLKEWCVEHLQDPKDIREPLHALSVSAIRWRDFNRWDSSMRAFNVHKNLRLLPFEVFAKACKEFGFLLMKPFLQDAMIHADGNGARYALLGYLGLAVPGEEFESFRRESRTTIVYHLSPPKEEDADFFAELAHEDGAENFQSVIPKLETFQPSLKFWCTLASKLRYLQGSSDQLADLAESITRKFFKYFEPFPVTWSRNPDVGAWIDALKAGIESEDRQRVIATIGQIVEATKLEHNKTFVANYYLVPSVNAIERMLMERVHIDITGPKPMGLQPSDQIFAPYWTTVIQAITYELLFGDQSTDPRNRVNALTKAIQFNRDPGPLRDLLLSRSEHETKDPDVEKEVKKLSKIRPRTLESLIRSLSELSIADFNEQEARDHNRLIRQLLRLHVQECNLPHLINVADVPKYRADLDSDVPEETPALCLIKLCYDVVGDSQPAIRIVLNRALGIPSKIDADYLFDQLSPFIRSLRSYLEKKTPPQDLTVQPYFGFINDVVSALKDFLKGKPARYEEIQSLISSSPSPRFHKFLDSPDEEVLRFSKPDKTRIQQELQSLFSCGFLRWTKDDAMKKDGSLIQANRWSISMEKAKALWRGIGSKDVLRRVVGDKLSEIENLLPENTPIVPDSPRSPCEPRTHSNPPFLPTFAITRKDTAAPDLASSSPSNRPVKRTLSGNTAPVTQTPHKKKRSEEKVFEMTNRRTPPRFL